MNRLNRRHFVTLAAAMGVTAIWAKQQPQRSARDSRERRDLYPQGVASGDPDSHSVLLWTRRPYSGGSRQRLTVEVSEDEAFNHVVATAGTSVSTLADWTCRVLVGNLKPASVYWYRFVDADGNASRVGRTMTAPSEDDSRPVRFAFVSCQNVNLGGLQAFRKMIFEDERAAKSEQLGFVLHLGDFIYEIVWYPEDRPQGFYDRRIRDVIRYPDGERIGDFHVPATLEDYRTAYRAYLNDPDLQDARARWPFVCIWDNHEFSINGWQSFQSFGGRSRPAQTRKVAANQAWFEYQPARVVKSSGPSLEQFGAPEVSDVPVDRFDANGMGDEPNNKAALASLTGYRVCRWGRHVDLIITDQRSYRSEEATARPEAEVLTSKDFPRMYPQEVLEILDGGCVYADGDVPATIELGGREIRNFCKDEPPQTLLGATQKAWFLRRLKESAATWKIWGNSVGTLDGRIDAQNFPVGLAKPWPGSGYAVFQTGDFGSVYRERAEIYATVRAQSITGFVTLCGNSHSFWAGLAAPALPPRPFEPVGAVFVTGSINCPGTMEQVEHDIPRDHPLRAFYVGEQSAGKKPEPILNLLCRHGARSSLEYQRTGDLKRARALSNPELSPHLSFLDLGGHGYSIVRASGDALECEFVCIPRPLERVNSPDGGPLRYRVVHRVPLWGKNEEPRLEQSVVEGEPTLSL